ncbi:protein-serine,threonine phosphatase, partial [Sarracenia purpurea var. burkii]
NHLEIAELVTTETSVPAELISQVVRRRRVENHRFKFLAADATVTPPENGKKCQTFEVLVPPRECENTIERCVFSKGKVVENRGLKSKSVDRRRTRSLTLPSIGVDHFQISPSLERS